MGIGIGADVECGRAVSAGWRTGGVEKDMVELCSCNFVAVDLGNMAEDYKHGLQVIVE